MKAVASLLGALLFTFKISAQPAGANGDMPTRETRATGPPAH
jgi:hypothetical protein